MAGPVAGVFPLYTVDAFTEQPFTGNPAAVCLDQSEQGLSEDVMQLIATEMNISETAFIRRLDADQSFKAGCRFGLRWFTPTNEVPLCGHATLAAAAVLFQAQGNNSQQLEFATLSGCLKAMRQGDNISLDLPLNRPKAQSYSELEDLIKCVVSADLIEDIQFCETTKKLLVRLQDTVTRSELECLEPDVSRFLSVHQGKVKGVIVTVKAQPEEHGYDVISRYFAPWNGIPEDPVTGSAHTVLAPYWSHILDKKTLTCRQCSGRGGDLVVTVRDDGRVDVAGKATVLISGTINIGTK